MTHDSHFHDELCSTLTQVLQLEDDSFAEQLAQVMTKPPYNYYLLWIGAQYGIDPDILRSAVKKSNPEDWALFS